jgi:hypothetical protein
MTVGAIPVARGSWGDARADGCVSGHAVQSGQSGPYASGQARDRTSLPSFPRFLLLSTVGRLPGMVVSVYAVSLLFTGPLWVWLAVGAATVAVHSWPFAKCEVGDLADVPSW